MTTTLDNAPGQTSPLLTGVVERLAALVTAALDTAALKPLGKARFVQGAAPRGSRIPTTTTSSSWAAASAAASRRCG